MADQLLDNPVTAAEVDGLFRAILRRPVDSEEWTRKIVASGVTVRDFVKRLRASDELFQHIISQGASVGTG